MKPIWLAQYPAGVPADIRAEAAQYTSLADMLEQSCRQNARKTAYISMGQRMSYAVLQAQAEAFAAWLQSRGVGKGDRVALMMPNLLQYPVCLLGVLYCGAAIVNTNPMYTVDELKHQLGDSGAETIVVAENFAHTLQQALPGTAVKRVIITSVGDMLGGLKGWLTNFVLRHVRRQIPAWQIAGTVRLNEALAQGARMQLKKPALTADDLAALQYTGGTTGVAKGAMLSHGNLVANVCQSTSWVRPYGKADEHCIVTALPLYHIFALTANCLSFLHLGASNLLIADPRDMDSFVAELHKTPFTAITGVNTLFIGLLNHPRFSQLDFSHLSITLGGGMAVQETIARRWLETTGVPIAQAYGLTETSPAVTINPFDKKDFNNSIGLPIPSTEVAIRNDNQPVAPGEQGEITIKGPQVMMAYWQRPEDTAASFDADGYLLTGDIGYMDEQGYFYILDRKKDMILVSGFNVYPNEVEAAAMKHPGVREVAAIGVPDSHSGEAVKLYVIRKDPDLTASELIAHCRQHLTAYKVPKHIEFREDLPRSNVGKILRRALKEEAKKTAAATAQG